MKLKLFLQDLSVTLAWKRALPVFLLLVLLLACLHPSFGPNGTAGALTALLTGFMTAAVHAQMAAVLMHQERFSKYLLCWSIPLLAIIAETVNGTLENAAQFHTGTVGYFLAGNLLLMAKWLLLETTRRKPRLNKLAGKACMATETALLTAAIMVVANRLVNGRSLLLSDILTVSRMARQEAVDVVFQQYHGTVILTILALVIPAILTAYQVLDGADKPQQHPKTRREIITVMTISIMGSALLMAVGTICHKTGQPTENGWHPLQPPYPKQTAESQTPDN